MECNKCIPRVDIKKWRIFWIVGKIIRWIKTIWRQLMLKFITKISLSLLRLWKEYLDNKQRIEDYFFEVAVEIGNNEGRNGLNWWNVTFA